MRRASIGALLAVLVGAIGAFPGTAGAANKWTGVVIGKDPVRNAVVTASGGGVVRTLRTPTKARSLRVGHRISVQALALPDGTFRAQGVRVAGRATKARIRAVVIRRQRALGRYLVSAGGSVLAIRTAPRRGVRTTASASGDGPQPGDKVVIDATLSGGTPSATSLQTVGHVSVLELEGIFLGLSGDGKIRIAVAHRGEVLVAPAALVAGAAATAMPAFKPGDEIQLAVSVDATGAFTLVHAQSDGEDEDEGLDIDDDNGELEVEGTIKELTGMPVTSITVQPGRNSAPVMCAVPPGVSLAGFQVGDRVEMECELVGTAPTLTKLKRDDHDDDEEEADGEVEDEDEDDDD